MEDIIMQFGQQVLAGGVGMVLAVGGLFVLYKLGNKYLDKRRVSRETFSPVSQDDENVNDIVLREIKSCNARHNDKWDEVKSGLIGAIREEIRQDYEETRQRIDRLFEIIAARTN